MINTNKPSINTEIVFDPAPFHSFNIIPHRLLNITFNDIRILHENAIIILPSSKKLCPIPNPKNCEYHNNPARAQKDKLFTQLEPEIDV